MDPVVEGIVRPKQDRLGDTNRERVIPLLIHGDAAFAGQGVVAETLNLSQLDGYSTGGTIHVIINNQIGFTTHPDESRSTPYSTDVARGVQAPIFHVNGDDPDAAIRVVQIAFDYRQQFKKDVVIDMICYRRHGHNEGDDPSYTQPIMYRKIKEHPSVAVLYTERLVREGVLTAEEVQPCARLSRSACPRPTTRSQTARRAVRSAGAERRGAATSIGGFCPRTSVNRQVLERVIRGITQFPENFHLHPKLRGFVEKRREAIAEGWPNRLGVRRSAGLRHPGAGRHAGTAQRPGFRPRHLQPAPSGVLRFRERQALHPAAAHLAGPGSLRRLRQLAQRICGAGLRVRL